MNFEICRAISERRLIDFAYRGYWCTVEPHLYGANQRRKDVLQAYQTEGQSIAGEGYGWKVFYVAEIDQLTVRTETFEQAREEYQHDSGDSGDSSNAVISTIYCAL